MSCGTEGERERERERRGRKKERKRERKERYKLKEKCMYVFSSTTRVWIETRLPPRYCQRKMRARLSLIHAKKHNISNDFNLEWLEIARDFPELAFSQLPLNEVLARANNETGRILNSMARTRFL